MPENTNQSILRAAALLRRVADTPGGVSVPELAAHLQVSRPTAHNLAVTLRSEGFLIKQERPVRYTLGPEPARLAAQARAHGLRIRARDLITELAGAHPGTGWVYAEAEDDDMRIIWRLDYAESGRIERVDREVSHPYDTATALLFHALAPAPRAEAMRRRFPFEEFGRAIWGSREAFEQELNRIREAGHVADHVSTGRQLRAMAVPIFNQQGHLAASVGAFFGLEHDPAFRTRVESAILRAVTPLQELPASL